MIKHEFVIKYNFHCSNPDHDKDEEWYDDDACDYPFDPDDPKDKELALKAAWAYADYLAHQDFDEEHPTLYRVEYRLTSDEVVSA